jgi:putative nucleotidyltransferase with HDIG domain
MEITVKVQDLEPGMYLTKICGAWLSHPFWKKQFLLTYDDIAALKATAIEEVVIDTSKGIGPAKKAEAIIQLQPALVTQKIKDIPVKKYTVSEEAKRAKNIVTSSTKIIKNLFNEARMGSSLNETDAKEIVEEITSSILRNPDTLISIARLKTIDDYTYMHSVSVCALMVSLAKNLGYDNEFCKKAGMAGLYHDIGKMFIPVDILTKPGKLTDEEYTIMKEHPKQGWEFLQNSEVISKETLDVCLHHHEKMDGTGYPFQLKSDDISVLAKMGAICDVYDAVTSDRPYKKGWEPSHAIKSMSEWKNHFDPTIFGAFVKSIGIYPVGSLVKLTSGRLAVVIERNEKSLLHPRVKVFFSTKSQCRIKPEIVNLASPGAMEKIESYENPAEHNLGDLTYLWTE